MKANHRLDWNRLYCLDYTAETVYALAESKGFHPDGETEDLFVERFCNNLHDEISELHEAWREGRLRKPCDKAAGIERLGYTPLNCLEEEMADILIRVLDGARRFGLSVSRIVDVKHAYNRTRRFRHGGKKS